jgi:hypothetical protein
MQPVLINGGQFVPQRLVEVIEDTGLASHSSAPDCALGIKFDLHET